MLDELDVRERLRIVDEALASIKRSGITKFGFVGNEQFRQFGKAAVMPK